jgi:coenzyme F420-reducing hydrogenase beta subunit
MKSDEEGFLYPEVDKTVCNGCDLCVMVCPVNKYAEKETRQSAFLVRHKDERILKESTSGGAFTAIAEIVLNKNGVVFGAAFDENLRVKHVCADNKDDLYRFRNSKYVQSEIGPAFKEAKEFLEQGREVCFSGTPCQVEGLKSFLCKDYDNLVLVDVVCHSIISP